MQTFNPENNEREPKYQRLLKLFEFNQLILYEVVRGRAVVQQARFSAEIKSLIGDHKSGMLWLDSQSRFVLFKSKESVSIGDRVYTRLYVRRGCLVARVISVTVKSKRPDRRERPLLLAPWSWQRPVCMIPS